jgi:hypothetical protein
MVFICGISYAQDSDPNFRDARWGMSKSEVKKSEEKVKEALFQVYHMIYDDELNEILEDGLSYSVPVSEVKEVLTGDDVDRFEKLVPEDKKVISKDRLREMTSTNAGR